MATAVHDFRFVAAWDVSVYNAYGAGTPELKTAVQAAVAELVKVHLSLPGIQVLRVKLTFQGQLFAISLATNAQAAQKYF